VGAVGGQNFGLPIDLAHRFRAVARRGLGGTPTQIFQHRY